MSLNLWGRLTQKILLVISTLLYKFERFLIIIALTFIFQYLIQLIDSTLTNSSNLVGLG